MADRYKKVVWGPHGTRKLTSPAKWREPVRWNKRAEGLAERPRVFCASLADVFEDWDGPIYNSKMEPLGKWDGIGEVPLEMDDVRRRLFALIDATPNLDWLILTKRPENIRRMWLPHPDGGVNAIDAEWRHNVWLLTSPTDQKTHDAAWPHLARCRDLAPVLGISAEPLTGPIDLGGARPDWIIAGGESGRDARPCCVEWVDDLRSQACLAGIPFFAKQLGAKPVTTNANLYDFEEVIRTEEWGTAAASCGYVLKDPKGGDWEEWPSLLRVREFPNAR